MKPREVHIRGVELPPDTPGETDIREYLVSYDEAVRVVKDARGWAVFITARQRGIDKADQHFFYEVFNSIKVSKRTALEYLEQAYYPQIRERVYVKLQVLGSCLFIGG